MNQTQLVDRETWLEARKALLAEEKAFTRARDRLSAARRALPMVRIDKPYRFDTEQGERTLPELFDDHRQLVVYHFMFGSSWSEGCPSCSFWADNYDGLDVHLAARDTALVTASIAPLPALLEYKKRMGWRFNWVSTGGSDFNADFGVSFKDGEPGPTQGYNYRADVPGMEMPGVSVFRLLDDETVAHSYSTYGRGLDMLNTAYHLLDLTPIGRDEDGLPFAQSWVRRHDQYGN